MQKASNRWQHYLAKPSFSIVAKKNNLKWQFVKSTYSAAHISWHELFLAGNQGNHQNLVQSMLTYKF